jgi:uncharacterized membrane protein HdeD (DUF308 family)
MQVCKLGGPCVCCVADLRIRSSPFTVRDREKETGSFVLATLNIAIGLLLFGTSAAAVMIRSDVFGILLLVQGIAFMLWAFRVNDQT